MAGAPAVGVGPDPSARATSVPWGRRSRAVMRACWTPPGSPGHWCRVLPQGPVGRAVHRRPVPGRVGLLRACLRRGQEPVRLLDRLDRARLRRRVRSDLPHRRRAAPRRRSRVVRRERTSAASPALSPAVPGRRAAPQDPGLRRRAGPRTGCRDRSTHPRRHGRSPRDRSYGRDRTPARSLVRRLRPPAHRTRPAAMPAGAHAPAPSPHRRYDFSPGPETRPFLWVERLRFAACPVSGGVRLLLGPRPSSAAASSSISGWSSTGRGAGPASARCSQLWPAYCSSSSCLGDDGASTSPSHLVALSSTSNC